MYEPIEGGTIEHIQGLDCNLPLMPPLEDIPGYFLSKEKQKWQRTELPDFDQSEVKIVSGMEYPEGYRLTWDEAKREELIAQTGYDPMDLSKRPKIVYEKFDEFYVNPKMEAFRAQEFDRIDNGYWFMNKGKPVYITGFHYAYLNWWRLNTGYPGFRVTDRRLFIFWQFCYEDPRCYGILEVTKRGQGKSYRVGCILYFISIRFKHAHCGIQSKTDDDAAKFFKGQVVEPHKELPEFLVPINNHGTEPKSELSWFPPAKKSHGARFIKRQEALRSYIDFRSSKESAYDGSTVKFLVQDEFAKLEPPLNAQKRLGVNREVVYRDMKMIGKIYCTTTVEDMRKGGDVCEIVWNNSNLKDRSENGMTVSGLYPFFTSALECSVFDEYGESDIEAAKIRHDAELKSKENDPVEYIGYKQKNPYTIDDAFKITSIDCLFNAMVLEEAEERCKLDKLTTRGDFVWKDDVPFSDVEFVVNEENGRWEVSWLYQNDADSNRVRKIKSIIGFEYAPQNTHKGAIAYDPFSHAKTVFEKRRSKAGAAAFRNYDFWDDEYSETWVADYVYRTPDPNEAHMDIIKMAWYYGYMVLVENQKNQFVYWCKENGCYDFIMMRPISTLPRGGKQTEGIPSSELVVDFYISTGQGHIHHHGWKCKHLRIIKDLKKFTSENRTKYDLGVAALLSIVGAARPKDDQTYDEDRDESMEISGIAA